MTSDYLLILQENLLSEDLMEILVLPAVKSLLTLMVVMELTAVELFPVKTPQKLTGQLPMQPVILPRTLLQPEFAIRH